MVNIMFPMAKKSKFFNEQKYSFPLYMQEIGNQSILSRVIDNYKNLNDDINFIFILSKDDCHRYYTDNVTKLLTNGKCNNVLLENETKGSICTCLMGIDYINNIDELIIANSDQLFTCNLNDKLNEIRRDGVDAAVLYFNSVHPRWSFVKMDESKNIVEASEKKPISTNAIAGFYYFKHGEEFVKSGMEAIKSGLGVVDCYYVSLALNQLILKNKQIKGYQVDDDEYYSLYSFEKIEEYKHILRERK